MAVLYLKCRYEIASLSKSYGFNKSGKKDLKYPRLNDISQNHTLPSHCISLKQSRFLLPIKLVLFHLPSVFVPSRIIRVWLIWYKYRKIAMFIVFFLRDPFDGFRGIWL